VSDSASAIADSARVRANAEGTIIRLRDYLSLYDKLDSLVKDRKLWEREKNQIQASIDAASSRREVAEQSIRRSEANLEDILERFGAPRFASVPQASIDRNSYLPIVDGRKFDDLSSLGLQVLVNVAYILANQRTSLSLNLSFPGILLIDGITSNVGHEGLDLQRVENMFDYLISVGEELGEQLQIIVADGNIPSRAERFVRLRLSENDRLIPL